MSGVTANGWPYVTPDDHPLEYPAFSQQFAQRFDGARAWTGLRGANGDFAAATWTGLVPVALTGLPAGGIAAVVATCNLKKTAVGALLSRLTSVGGTFAPSPAQAAVSVAANAWGALPVCGILTATTTSPTVTLEGWGDTGTVTVDAGTHLIAFRLL